MWCNGSGVGLRPRKGHWMTLGHTLSLTAQLIWQSYCCGRKWRKQYYICQILFLKERCKRSLENNKYIHLNIWATIFMGLYINNNMTWLDQSICKLSFLLYFKFSRFYTWFRFIEVHAERAHFQGLAKFIYWFVRFVSHLLGSRWGFEWIAMEFALG